MLGSGAIVDSASTKTPAAATMDAAAADTTTRGGHMLGSGGLAPRPGALWGSDWLKAQRRTPSCREGEPLSFNSAVGKEAEQVQALSHHLPPN